MQPGDLAGHTSSTFFILVVYGAGGESGLLREVAPLPPDAP
jgi:hypothetical protein